MKYQLLELRSSLLNDQLFNMLQEIPKLMNLVKPMNIMEKPEKR